MVARVHQMPKQAIKKALHEGGLPNGSAVPCCSSVAILAGGLHTCQFMSISSQHSGHLGCGTSPMSLRAGDAIHRATDSFGLDVLFVALAAGVGCYRYCMPCTACSIMSW
jgi:hypothetical protein